MTYDWEIIANKFFLKFFSFIFKPIFTANHHWAMKKGEESLKLELLRRKSKTKMEKDAIPDPPQPTFPHKNYHKKKRLND